MTDHEGVPVAVVSGEVDFGTAPRLRDAVVKVATDGARLAVVDLSEVQFLDSTGLGVLVACLKRFRSLGGDLRLVVTSDRVRNVFEITGLTTAFGIHETVAAAVAQDRR
ncbi:MAG: STAS domain-containing protein [Acidimicrobiia bacterium]|nr:STAS domain-containing protein [Acidimicrobiia bacterium]